MRPMLRWTLIPGALMALACRDGLPDSALQTDLALLNAGHVAPELAPSAGANVAVVSDAERVNVPGPKPVPEPTRKRAPKASVPETVEVEPGADDAVTAPQMVTVSPSEEPTAAGDPAPEPVPDAAPAIRPQPIEPVHPVGRGTIFGNGPDRGTGNGGVVIRGGRTGRDPCAIHDERGRRPSGGVLINDRIPGRPTFPRR